MDVDASQSTVTPLVVPEIVTLPDEVDIANAARYGRDLTDAFAGGASVVIADMSLTDFCDSTGIRYLIIANTAARRAGGELRVVVRSPAVLRVLEITGVDKVLRMYSSLGAALCGKPDLEADAS